MKSARIPKEEKKPKDECPDIPATRSEGGIPLYDDTVKHSLWTEPITNQSSPPWPCPKCHKGTLVLAQPPLVSNAPPLPVSKETNESWLKYHECGYPDKGRAFIFSAWLKCSYKSCEEDVVVAGTGRLGLFQEDNDEVEDEDADGGPRLNYRLVCEPLFCHPMPDMIKFSEKCPAEVKSELRAGFRLFWSDQAASAYHVRGALEHLLDQCGIPKCGKDENDKPSALSLYERIERFTKKKTIAGEKLAALKWLGNSSGHQETVTRDDLLDAFGALEYLITRLFDVSNTSLVTADAPSPRYALRKGEGIWTLVFNGKAATLKHEQGIYYVSYLLKNPQETPIYGVDLQMKDPSFRRKQIGITGTVKMNEDKDENEDEDDDEVEYEVVPLEKDSRIQERSSGFDDRESLQAVRKEQKKCKAILDDPDATELEKNEAERNLEKIEEYLKKGLRQTKSNADKSVRAVSAAIKRFYEHMAKATQGDGQPDPVCTAFAGHLQKYLRTPSKRCRNSAGGAGCFTYEPPSGVTWAD